MRLTARERFLIVLVAASGTLVLGYYLGVEPALRAVEEAGAGKGAEIASARRLLARAPGILARRAQLAEALSAARRAYPAEDQVDLGGLALLALVEKTAAATGLTLDAKGLGPATTDGDPAKITVEIHGNGDARAVVGFLHALGTARYRCDLESLDLVAGEGERLEMRAVVSTLLPGVKGERRDG